MECIICLSDDVIENDEELAHQIINISNVSGILKTCDCDYNCHANCILKWIKTNPHCLLCNNNILYDGMPNQVLNSENNSTSTTNSEPLNTEQVVELLAPNIIVRRTEMRPRESAEISVSDYGYALCIVFTLLVIIMVMIVSTNY